MLRSHKFVTKGGFQLFAAVRSDGSNAQLAHFAHPLGCVEADIDPSFVEGGLTNRQCALGRLVSFCWSLVIAFGLFHVTDNARPSYAQG